jgi:hypothetical protein
MNPESSAYPLPYKKQQQQGVTHWAVGGRDGVRFNTQCHQVYQKLLLADWYLRQSKSPEPLWDECCRLWRELAYLWNSDFRTFTTEDKNLEFRNRMGAALDRCHRLHEALQNANAAPGQLWLTNCVSVAASAEPVSFSIESNGARAEGIPAYELELFGDRFPCQVTQENLVHMGAGRVTLEVIPSIAPAQTAPAILLAAAGDRCLKMAGYSVDTQRHTLETESVKLRLNPQRGGALEELTFPAMSTQPLLIGPLAGNAQAGTFDEAPAAGEVTLVDWLGRKASDVTPVQLQYPDPSRGYEIFVPVRCSVQTELGTIWKAYRVYLHLPRIDLTIHCQWRDMVPRLFRVAHMTLNPQAFDRATLYYATVNGGTEVERFPLAGQRVQQWGGPGDNVGVPGCLGATEGWVVLGDVSKGLGFVTRMASLYSVPMLQYRETGEMPGGFTLTLAHSLGEKDDASHTLWRGYSSWTVSILGGAADIVQVARSCALLANGGLVVRPSGN